MSTILCTEKKCIYQKDGICNLDTITMQIIPEQSSACIYYRDDYTITDSKNEEKNLQT